MFSLRLLRPLFKVESSKFAIFVLISAINVLLFSSGCSIPNLESPDCNEARNVVRELYSTHLGNDMKPSAEYLNVREKFLSAELNLFLKAQNESAEDFFTQTADYPKTFRVGKCTVIEPDNRVRIQVLLFWKDDTRDEQKEVFVEAVNQSDTWLINKVEN